MKKKETKVISFRVSDDIFVLVNKQAKKAKKVRARFVENLFIPAFKKHVETNETETALAK